MPSECSANAFLKSVSEPGKDRNAAPHAATSPARAAAAAATTARCIFSTGASDAGWPRCAPDAPLDVGRFLASAAAGWCVAAATTAAAGTRRRCSSTGLEAKGEVAVAAMAAAATEDRQVLLPAVM